MTNKDKIYMDKIYSYIADQYFMSAIIEMRNVVKKYPEKAYIYDSLNDIEMVLRQMIQYKFNGVEDPQQGSIMDKIKNDLYDISDSLKFHDATVKLINDKNIKVFHVINQWETCNVSNNTTEEQLQLVRDIFIQIVFDDNVKNISSGIKSVLIDGNADEVLKQMVASALMLRLLLTYNKSLFLILVESIIKECNPAVKGRLYVSFIFVFFQYYSRIINEKDAMYAVHMVIKDENHYNNISEILKNIVRSLDTFRIYNKIQNGLLKEVAKYSSKISKDSALLDDDNNLNPKWLDIVENKDIAEKVREFQELQLSGYDVYYSTFVSMKFFPFFGEISNWFLPFMPKHPSLQSASTDNKTLEVFSKMDQFCDSDKYSLFLGLSHFPNNMIDNMLSSTGADIDMLKEDQVGEEWKSKLALSKNPATVRGYIQDLYRFFNSTSFSNYITNPFKSFVDFFIKLTDDTIFGYGLQREIADMLFDEESWAECILIYCHLDNKQAWDLFFYQRYAFSLQKNKSFESAIEIYNKAELIDNNDVWSKRQKAFCFLQLEDIPSAIECYKSILLHDENNIAVLIKLAGCYSKIEMYDEEKKILYKVDFLTENNYSIRKKLGWALLMLGEKENALKYYNVLYDDNQLNDEDDYLYGGLVFLANKDFVKALDLFTKYLKVTGENHLSSALFNSYYYEIRQYISRDEYTLFINQLFMNI